MIATLLLALPLSQEPSKALPPFDAKKAITTSVLEEEIDRSLHWLRSRFDPQRGTYGGEDDALVLVAFALSPRAYRLSDGPFIDKVLGTLVAAQKADGSIGRPAQTHCFVDAVRSLKAENTYARALEKAEAFLATNLPPEMRSRPHAQPERPPCTASVDELDSSTAAKKLAERHPDGSWGSPETALKDTAVVVLQLSFLHQRLKAEAAKSAPRDAKPLPTFSAAQRAEVETALGRGANYLLAEVVDGGWGFEGHKDAGITAMALGALLAVPEPRPEPVQKALTSGLDWLVTLQQEDGSIHQGQLANYVTSASILALVEGGRASDRPAIERGREFLKRLQADEGEGYSSGDRYYGGVGYGGDERPDLSNLQMALEALNASGVPPSDASFQKALVFLQRCQNRSETNDLTVVTDGKTYTSGNDGGAGYAPAESKAGFVELADGKRVPRSYGSMSYALLKGYLFAGIAKDDPRVQALWKWLRENYTLDVNPGFQTSDDPTAAYQGLFYYFHSMAKALDLFGETQITDGAGVAHDWRAELCGRLLAMQRQDGSWLNENAARWFEGNPVLATSYAMLTLGIALPAKP